LSRLIYEEFYSVPSDFITILAISFGLFRQVFDNFWNLKDLDTILAILNEYFYN
jgi:hypothetical protein